MGVMIPKLSGDVVGRQMKEKSFITEDADIHIAFLADIGTVAIGALRKN